MILSRFSLIVAIGFHLRISVKNYSKKIMKNILLLASLVLASSSALLNAQSEDHVQILAVQLTEAAAAPYLKEYRVTGVTVSEKGILRPQSGYDMFLQVEKQQFIVKPIKTEVGSTDDYEAKEVPGGTMFCMCGAENDDCSISVAIDNGTISYFCDGSCGCGSFVIFDVNENTPTFQSASGDWSSFSKH